MHADAHLRSVRQTAPGLLLVLVGLVACGTDNSVADRSPESTVPSSTEAVTLELGDPVPSGVGPAVVPSTAVRNVSGGPGFFEVPGADGDAVIAWYQEHMPPGSDFEGLVWLEALPDAFDAAVDWYWCSDTAESLDIAIYDGGEIGISISPVSDGACG